MRFFGPVSAAVLMFSASTTVLSQAGYERGSQGASNASAMSLAGSGFVVAGASELIVSGAQLTVTAMQAAGESMVIVMRGTSEAVTVSVRTTAKLAGEASVAVGSTIRVVAESVGHALLVGGKLIAFVPNEIGRSLIHHSVRDSAPRK